MGAAAVKDSVLDVLKGTSVGRKLAEEVEAEAEAREARVAARAKLDAGMEARKTLPKLAEDVEKAEAAYRTEVARLSGELHAAQVAYNSAVNSADRLVARAESVLRRGAHALVSESGPVLRALDAAIDHLRSHRIPVGDEDRIRRMAELKPRSPAPEDSDLIMRARAEVLKHDASLELEDALRIAAEDIRDLQLAVEVQPAAVREVLEGLPTSCIGFTAAELKSRGLTGNKRASACHHEFGLEAALQKAIAPQEMK